VIALVLGLLLGLDANAQSRKAVLTRRLLRAPRSLHSFDDYRSLDMKRQVSMFVPSVATLFRTAKDLQREFYAPERHDNRFYAKYR
jgi:hypothetical protein